MSARCICLLIGFSIDPTFCGKFVCGPLRFKCQFKVKSTSPSRPSFSVIHECTHILCNIVRCGKRPYFFPLISNCTYQFSRTFRYSRLSKVNKEHWLMLTPSKFVGINHFNARISFLAEGLLYPVAIWPVAGQGVENTK